VLKFDNIVAIFVAKNSLNVMMTTIQHPAKIGVRFIESKMTIKTSEILLIITVPPVTLHQPNSL